MQEQQNEKNAILVENQYLRNIIDRAVSTKKRMGEEATIMQKAIQILNIQSGTPRQSLENELVRAIEKLHGLHKQAEESNSYFEDLEKEVIGLRLGISGLSDEREKYITALKEMKELAKDLGKESKDFYEQKEALRVELEKCNVEKLELTDTQKEIEKEFNSLKLEYENKMQQMKTDFSDYILINRKQKESLQQITLELDSTKLKVKEYEEKLATASNELEKIISERDLSVQSANNLQLQIQELIKNKEVSTSSIQELQTKIANNEEELSKTKKSLDQTLTDLQKISKEKKEKEDQNKRLIELCNKLEQKNRLQQEANEVLEEERVKYEHNLHRMNGLLEKAREESYLNQSLEQRETEKDLTIKRLREQISLYEDELKIMKERLGENYQDLSDEDENPVFHTKKEKVDNSKQLKSTKQTKKITREDHTIEKNSKINTKPPLIHKQHASPISESSKKNKSPSTLNRDPSGVTEGYREVVKKLMLVSGEASTKKTPHKTFI